MNTSDDKKHSNSNNGKKSEQLPYFNSFSKSKLQPIRELSKGTSSLESLINYKGEKHIKKEKILKQNSIRINRKKHFINEETKKLYKRGSVNLLDIKKENYSDNSDDSDDSDEFDNIISLHRISKLNEETFLSNKKQKKVKWKEKKHINRCKINCTNHSKLSINWSDIEDEILLIDDNAKELSIDRTERWKSHSEASKRSNHARNLMNINNNNINNSLNEKYTKRYIDSLNQLVENHKISYNNTTNNSNSSKIENINKNDEISDHSFSVNKKKKNRRVNSKNRNKKYKILTRTNTDVSILKSQNRLSGEISLISSQINKTTKQQINTKEKEYEGKYLKYDNYNNIKDNDTKEEKLLLEQDDISITQNKISTPVKNKLMKSVSSVSLPKRIKPLSEQSNSNKSKNFQNQNELVSNLSTNIKKRKKTKGKGNHFKWKRKSLKLSLESDLLERGRTQLNDIRIASNPYQTRREFIISIQKESNLLEKLSVTKQTDDNYYSIFENTSNFNIIFENNEEEGKILTFCSLIKLIQYLFHYDNLPDYHLISVFLLSYRALISPNQLMELLIYRAFGRPREDKLWSNWLEKSLSLQKMILQFLCNWIDQCYPYDFYDRPHMMYMLAHFVYFLDTPEHQKNLLLRILGSRGVNFQTKKTLKPIIPSKQKNSKLLLENLNPTEIASQLALVEFDIFCSISPVEYLHQNWCSNDKNQKAPNILRMIEQFNSISNWVASEILKISSLKQRVLMLNRFIFIAEESRALRNYNSVMAILAGLQSTPIYRLKETWNLLPERSWDIWDNLNELMGNDNNFSCYRNQVRTSKPPRIPYIGVFLTDLVTIEEAHSYFKEKTNLINISKLKFIASVLFILEGCKKGKYEITPIPALQASLLATPSLSEEEQKNLSLSIESL